MWKKTYIFLMIGSSVLSSPFLIHSKNNYQTKVQRVTNGQDVQFGKYPWFGRFSINSEDALSKNANGAGVLINQSWVLTAAHVATHANVIGYGQFSFNIYDINQKEKPIVAEIDKVYIHPKYNSEIADLALVKLKKPILDIKPIKLANFDETPVVDSISTIIGYGISGVDPITNRPIYPTKMQEAQVPIIDSKWLTQDGVDEGMIKTFNEKYDLLAGNVKGKRMSAGLGDSGGPLIQIINNEEVLIGITKGALYDWVTPMPSIFSAIYKYRVWIDDTVKHETEYQSTKQNILMMQEAFDKLPIFALKTNNPCDLINWQAQQILVTEDFGWEYEPDNWFDLNLTYIVKDIDLIKGQLHLLVQIEKNNQFVETEITIWGFKVKNQYDIEIIKNIFNSLTPNQLVMKNYSKQLRHLQIGDIVTKENIGFQNQPKNLFGTQITYIIDQINFETLSIVVKVQIKKGNFMDFQKITLTLT